MISRIKSILRQKGFELNTRPYELNIIGLRNKSTRANSFDDEIHVFFKDKNMMWQYYMFKATTDPGTYWLENPLQPQGTAILAQGQYRNAYEIGFHNNQYKALVQRGPVKIIRDYDRNARLDFMNGKKEKGQFGINIHRALEKGKTKSIDKFSAGCQVFENAEDFDQFMNLCERHRQLYGNSFTYSLVDLRAIYRESWRRIAIGTLTLGFGLFTLIFYDND